MVRVAYQERIVRMTKQDREEFAAFCRNATDRQLIEIEAKERSARRFAYAEIANQEAASR